jgi:hypothetical protein
MARKTKPQATDRPQFDAEPLHDDDEEHTCPIPDEDGNIVLRRGKSPEGKRRGKGSKAPKPRR